MAYSRTPTYNSHQLVRLPVKGSQMLTGSLDIDVGMRYVDCFPRTIKQYASDPEHMVVRRPVFESVAVSGYSGTIRGAGNFGTESKFYIVGNALVSQATGTAVTTLFTNTGYCGVTEAYLGSTIYLVVLETHTPSSRLTLWDGATATTIDLGFYATGDPVFLDGYLFIAEAGTNRIYNSEVGSLTTWTLANNFIEAEMEGDTLVTLGKHRNHIVAFGRRTIEFFYNGAIEIGSPLVRQEAYASYVGHAGEGVSTYYFTRTCYLGNSLFFFARVNGSFAICRLEDFKVKIISDPVLHRIINTSSSSFLTAKLFPVNCWGSLGLLFGYIESGSTYTWFHYDLESETWAWWNMVEGFTPRFHINESYFIGNTGANITVDELISDEDFGGVTLPATVTFDVFDGGNDSQKHFKYVDILGSLGTSAASNSVALYFSKDWEPYTFVESIEATGSVRFRNICRARRISFRVTFSGTAPLHFRGLDVAYNNGVY